METTSTIAAKIARQQDDLLASIQLVRESEILQRKLFDHLADRLLAGLFADLKHRHSLGKLSDAELATELLELTAECHRVGLVPPV